jgi:hypothetical protein
LVPRTLSGMKEHEAHSTSSRSSFELNVSNRSPFHSGLTWRTRHTTKIMSSSVYFLS